MLLVSSTSPYLHVAIIVQSPALPSRCYYCAITSPYLHVAIIVQSPAPTFTLLLLCNHQPLPLRYYYCAIAKLCNNDTVKVVLSVVKLVPPHAASVC